MSLGAGTAVPPASASSQAACCALWHFINSAGSAPAPLPAPRHPLALAAPGGGTAPAAGASAGPVPKRAWEPGAAMAGGYF